jgi:hypothetical protein
VTLLTTTEHLAPSIKQLTKENNKKRRRALYHKRRNLRNKMMKCQAEIEAPELKESVEERPAARTNRKLERESSISSLSSLSDDDFY